MSKPITPEIFVSYAWEPESEKIIDQFETVCLSRGFRLVRDKTDIQFKGLITEFMKSVGQGRFVLVVLSDKYLQSENCMFELLEIARNGNFYNRIFPIITESARFYKPIGRIRYIQHWEKEIEELNEAMVSLKSQADLAGIRDSIDLYTRIRATIADLTSILKDMNSLTVQQHIKANFEDVFTLIERDIAAENEGASPAEAIVVASESDIAEKKKQDRTIANLLKVTFPQTIYVAKLTLNRSEIIEKSWETDFKLTRKATDRKVALRALLFTNAPFDSEFEVFNHLLISFHDLGNRSKAYSRISEAVESYTVEEFLDSNPAVESVFISLLNLCFRQKVNRKEIEWIKSEKCYRFRVGPIAKEKKITWKGIKQATRTVIFERFNKEKTQIVAFRHLAFKATFLRFQTGFYLAINPTWSLTRDGWSEYVFAADEITALKRVENNGAVYNHFRFLQFCLLNSLSETDTYDLLTLAEIDINQV